jgi:hypothetical protein
MVKIVGPKYNSKKLYQRPFERRRYARYRDAFIPYKLSLTYSRNEWKDIIYLVLMELSMNSIAELTRFEQGQVYININADPVCENQRYF